MKVFFYILICALILFAIGCFVVSIFSWNGGEGPSADEYNWNKQNYPQYGPPQQTVGSPEWVREQRNKMNRNFAPSLTLREFILERDNYTCQFCGNSIRREPNLLLEVDHITPVSKGGASIPGNLQTLCWKCNRSKSNRI